MDNLHQTEQLVIDLRHAREAEACRRRLAKGDREALTCPNEPARRRHHFAGFGRHLLAGG